jgi:hypothetical protein
VIDLLQNDPPIVLRASRFASGGGSDRRDRSSFYADGGRQGASSAVQITDRYHLVSNLSEAVERDVQQLQIDARKQLA